MSSASLVAGKGLALGNAALLSTSKVSSNTISSQVDTSAPHKIIATKSKIQVTCEIIDFSILNGRADLKAIRSLIQKVNPIHVIVLRGNTQVIEKVTTFAKSLAIESFYPKNFESIQFEATVDRVKMQISQSLLQANVRTLSSLQQSNRLEANITTTNANTIQISTLRGQVLENINEAGGDGVRVFQLMETSDIGTTNSSQVIIDVDVDDMEEGDGDNEEEAIQVNTQETLEGNVNNDDLLQSERNADVYPLPIIAEMSNIGAISHGEIMFTHLKQLMEQHTNQSVEFRLSKSGGMLILGNQVIIRKTNETDFVIEGPPIPLYYTARKILYQQLVFI